MDLTSREAAEFLKARSEGDVYWLIGALRHPEIRPSAVKLLGDLGAVEAIPKIVPLLQSSSASLRRAAAHALGQLEASEALDALFDTALTDRDRTAREWALFAIGCIQLENDDQRLRKLSQDEVAQVRVAAIAALLAAKNPSLVALGVELRKREPWKQRRAIRRVSRRINVERRRSPLAVRPADGHS